MRRPRRSLLLLATALATTTLAALAPVPAGGAPSAPAAAAAAPLPVLALKAPRTADITTYGRNPKQQVPLDVRLVAGDAPFVVHSNRTGYGQAISTVWKGPGGDVPLSGAMTTFGPLRQLVRVTVTRATGEVVLSGRRAVCLARQSERVRPEAPAYSPYPRNECWSNPYALGQAQGIQSGWAVPVLGYESPLRLEAGRYRVEVTLTKPYAQALGVDQAATASVTNLRVRHRTEYPEERRVRPPSQRRGDPGLAAADEPDGSGDVPVDGPRPDLRSLPAWGITLNRTGSQLQFAATVWNAGDSPLVVDGFRRDGEDEMDAYQYFFDADGHQVDYRHVGHMHWDPRSTHQHWHFEDFATYTLLDADRKLVRTSGKEAFCLANTDSVDLTVPGAAWDPYNEDLETACGEYNSLSVREVLAAGWGDTYAQFRAGQSFDVRTLPDGVYYVAVTANPFGNLIEQSTTNNRSLRKIILGTRAGKRTVRVPQVGLVVEPENFWDE